MNLPLPEQQEINQNHPANFLKNIAISLWILVLVGAIAGLLFQLTIINGEKKVARADSQKAEAALVPALNLYNDINASNREEQLRQALEIIEKDVLKADATHVVAISTKHLIEEEIRGLKNSTIDQQEKVIQDKVRTLDQANREIERLKSTIAGLQNDKSQLQQNIGQLSQSVGQLQTELNQARQAVQTAQRQQAESSQAATSKEQQIGELLRQLQQLRAQRTGG